MVGFNIRFLLLALFLFSQMGVFAQKQSKPIREDIEWIDVFMPHSHDKVLPRVLLIGNSITRGYYPEVVKELEGKAYVARLATSKSVGDPALLKEIDLIMSYYSFDVVHFNNGLHGFGYTEEDYRKAFPDFVRTIRKGAPHAKLMWATITPVHNAKDNSLYAPTTDRIKVRNKIASDYLATQKDIQVDDLWSFALSHPEFYQGGDGTHPTGDGFKAFGKQVTEALEPLLQK